MFERRSFVLCLYVDINCIIVQLESLGETVEKYHDSKLVHHSTVSSPISNIYLQELAFLVQTKLRVGQALATSLTVKVDVKLVYFPNLFTYLHLFDLIFSLFFHYRDTLLGNFR
jgi:hypothetical protein